MDVQHAMLPSPPPTPSAFSEGSSYPGIEESVSQAQIFCDWPFSVYDMAAHSPPSYPQSPTNTYPVPDNRPYSTYPPGQAFESRENTIIKAPLPRDDPLPVAITAENLGQALEQTFHLVGAQPLPQVSNDCGVMYSEIQQEVSRSNLSTPLSTIFESPGAMDSDMELLNSEMAVQLNLLDALALDASSFQNSPALLGAGMVESFLTVQNQVTDSHALSNFHRSSDPFVQEPCVIAFGQERYLDNLSSISLQLGLTQIVPATSQSNNTARSETMRTSPSERGGGVLSVPRTRHRQNNSKEVSADLVCDICGQSCKRKHNLKNHMQRHDASRENMFKCMNSGCKQPPFARLHDLERHLDSVHKRKEPIQCAYCGYNTKKTTVGTAVLPSEARL
ncbi:uncharacterized protein PV09_08776 [Verruconis gallopava]|uniref:C2H2-type domain-containing protein n=1 Tax=Verruconis gallopava TaxID=253628 RepID=A0A0D1YFT1_9PEZI|nr:uncharacterized protein PV09_08776 [Verruconis gallopava]KIV99601.1 hypothetical protein PV09_08776 [Verruconis gallopava]